MPSTTHDATTSRVLREVANHIDEFGQHRTLSIILNDKKAKSNKPKSVQVHLDKIINIICSHFSVPIEKIYSRGRHDIKKKLAIDFICYYCYESLSKFGVTQKLISSKLQKTQAVICVYLGDMIKKKKNYSSENKIYQKHFKELEPKIEEYIKSIDTKAPNTQNKK